MVGILLVVISFLVTILMFCCQYHNENKKVEKTGQQNKSVDQAETNIQTPTDQHNSNSSNNITSDDQKKKILISSCIKVIFRLSMIVSTTLYFIGDNLEHVYTTYTYNSDLLEMSGSGGSATKPDFACARTRARVEQVALTSIYCLIFGIIGFRFIPLFEEKVLQICKVCQTNDENNDYTKKLDDKENDDKTKCPCYTALITMLGTIAEVDAWYTTMTTLRDGNVLKSSCSNSILIAVWIGFGLICFALIIYFLLIIVYFNDEKCASNWKCCGNYTALIVFATSLIFISAAYILGDNSEPFDCTINCGETNDKRRNIIHLVLISVSTSGYIIFFIVSLCILFCEVKTLEKNNKVESKLNQVPQASNSDRNK